MCKKVNVCRKSYKGHSIGGEFFQGEGVLDGEAVGVIVKVNENIFPLESPSFDFFSPSSQFLI